MIMVGCGPEAVTPSASETISVDILDEQMQAHLVAISNRGHLEKKAWEKFDWIEKYKCGSDFEACRDIFCQEHVSLCHVLPPEQELKSLWARTENVMFRLDYHDYKRANRTETDIKFCETLKSAFTNLPPYKAEEDILDMSEFFGANPIGHFRVDNLHSLIDSAVDTSVVWSDIPWDEYWEHSYILDPRTAAGRKTSSGFEYYDEPTVEIRDQGRHGGSLFKTLTRDEHRAEWKPQEPDPYLVNQFAILGGGEYALRKHVYASGEPDWPKPNYVKFGFWRMQDFKNGRFWVRNSVMNPAPSSRYTRVFHEDSSEYLTLIQISDGFWHEPKGGKNAQVQVIQFDMAAPETNSGDTLRVRRLPL